MQGKPLEDYLEYPAASAERVALSLLGSDMDTGLASKAKNP